MYHLWENLIFCAPSWKLNSLRKCVLLKFIFPKLKLSPLQKTQQKEESKGESREFGEKLRPEKMGARAQQSVSKEVLLTGRPIRPDSQSRTRLFLVRDKTGFQVRTRY
ncbi:hypothetical protein CEXT_455891 [Caerostris extrusa]|uniref:Uncharacterized protein n=1 Tax=Caerostris extrusa TaxID=172846 RepID=A0AAV4RH00_CAEEX|nr:hypothetical protein CEXT_455891 [Caerostris extrusa]